MIREFASGDIVHLIVAARWTVLLALAAMAGGGCSAPRVAVCRVVSFRPLNWLAIGYVNLIQGTPLLGQLFVFFFGCRCLAFMSIRGWRRRWRCRCMRRRSSAKSGAAACSRCRPASGKPPRRWDCPIATG